MQEYHFYLLDNDARIRSLKILNCLDDLAALEFAQAMKAPAVVEIWQETRLLTRLDANGESAFQADAPLLGPSPARKAP